MICLARARQLAAARGVDTGSAGGFSYSFIYAWRGIAAGSRSRGLVRLGGGGGPGCGTRRTSAAGARADTRGLSLFPWRRRSFFPPVGLDFPPGIRTSIKWYHSATQRHLWRTTSRLPLTTLSLSLQNGFPERYRRAVKASKLLLLSTRGEGRHARN